MTQQIALSARTDEQRARSSQAWRSVHEAFDAYLATLTKITLAEFHAGQPGDDADTDYEDQWDEVDFVVRVPDTTLLYSIAWTEINANGTIAVWAYDHDSNEACVAYLAPDTPVYFG